MSDPDVIPIGDEDPDVIPVEEDERELHRRRAEELSKPLPGLEPTYFERPGYTGRADSFTGLPGRVFRGAETALPKMAAGVMGGVNTEAQSLGLGSPFQAEQAALERNVAENASAPAQNAMETIADVGGGLVGAGPAYAALPPAAIPAMFGGTTYLEARDEGVPRGRALAQGAAAGAGAAIPFIPAIAGLPMAARAAAAAGGNYALGAAAGVPTEQNLINSAMQGYFGAAHESLAREEYAPPARPVDPAVIPIEEPKPAPEVQPQAQPEAIAQPQVQPEATAPGVNPVMDSTLRGAKIPDEEIAAMNPWQKRAAQKVISAHINAVFDPNNPEPPQFDPDGMLANARRAAAETVDPRQAVRAEEPILSAVEAKEPQWGTTPTAEEITSSERLAALRNPLVAHDILARGESPMGMSEQIRAEAETRNKGIPGLVEGAPEAGPPVAPAIKLLGGPRAGNVLTSEGARNHGDILPKFTDPSDLNENMDLGFVDAKGTYIPRETQGEEPAKKWGTEKPAGPLRPVPVSGGQAREIAPDFTDVASSTTPKVGPELVKAGIIQPGQMAVATDTMGGDEVAAKVAMGEAQERARAQGLSENQVLDRGNAAYARARGGDAPHGPINRPEGDPDFWKYAEDTGRVQDGFKIVDMDMDRWRKDKDPNAVEGVNGHASAGVPGDVIGIDKEIPPDQRPEIEAHELAEARAMRDNPNLSYPEAHAKYGNVAEKIVRDQRLAGSPEQPISAVGEQPAAGEQPTDTRPGERGSARADMLLGKGLSDVAEDPISAYRNFRDAITVDSHPKLGRAGVLPEAAHVATPRAYTDATVRSLMAQVYPEGYHDPAKMDHLGDVLNKSNVVGGYDTWARNAERAEHLASLARGDEYLQRAALARSEGNLEEANKQTRAAANYSDPVEEEKQTKIAAAYRESMAGVDEALRARGVVGQKEQARGAGIEALRAELDGVKANEPETMAAVQRWAKLVNGDVAAGTKPEDMPEMARHWATIKGIDPGQSQEGRGYLAGERVNLLDKAKADLLRKASDQDHPTTPEVASASSYTNPMVRRDAYDRAAKLTGNYETDPAMMLSASLGPRFAQASKIRLYQALEERGVGKLQVPGEAPPETLGGKPVAKLEVRVPETVDGRTGIVARNLWVQSDLVPEVRQVLKTDLPFKTNIVAKALNTLQLASFVDASAHAANIISKLGKAGSGTRVGDVLSLFPGLRTGAAILKIGKTALDLHADAPEVRSEVQRLADLGVLRPEYPATGLQKILPIQKFLHTMDTATRIEFNKMLDRATERGLGPKDTTERIRALEGLGQYNAAMMPRWASALKSSGLDPFIVAARNYQREGFRNVTGDPGWQAPTAGANAYLRTRQIAGTLMHAAIVPAIANYLITGNVGGRPGTPLGAIDTGKSDENGKQKYIDLLAMTGIRRGTRGLGIDAAYDGLRSGLTPNEIMGKMIRDMVTGQAHPYLGPAIAATLKVLGFAAPDFRGPFEPQKAEGAQQYWENLKAALKSTNPVIGELAGAVARHTGLSEGTPGDETLSAPESAWEETKKVGGQLLKGPASSSGLWPKTADTPSMRMLKEARRAEAIPLAPDEIQRVRFMNDVRSRLRRADQLQKSGDDQGYQSEIKAANAALASGYTKRVLSDKDVEKISGDWQADPRVHSFDGLRDWHSAVKVYAAGTPEEQQLWRESLEKKINSEIAKDPRKQDDILAEVQQRFGGH